MYFFGERNFDVDISKMLIMKDKNKKKDKKTSEDMKFFSKKLKTFFHLMKMK